MNPLSHLWERARVRVCPFPLPAGEGQGEGRSPQPPTATSADRPLMSRIAERHKAKTGQAAWGGWFAAVKPPDTGNGAVLKAA